MPTSRRDDIVSGVTALLVRRFPRIASPHVVETVGEEYDALADRPIQMYVGNLVEHAARSRLAVESARPAIRDLPRSAAAVGARLGMPGPGPTLADPPSAARGGGGPRGETAVRSLAGAGAEAPAADRPDERIVLAADDSFGTIAAADWLADRGLRVRLTVEIAVVEGHVRAGSATGPDREIGEGVAWHMREYLVDRLPHARTSIRVLEGDVVQALREAASDGQLLVIGCNRHGLWHRLPFATRSTRIAEVAVRPTVVVPAAWSGSAGAVVAAIHDHDTEVVDWAAREAAGAGRELVLVHSDRLDLRGATTPSSMPDLQIDAADLGVLAEHARRARESHPGLVVHTVTRHGGVVPTLREHASNAAMLVIGTRADRGPRAGSVLRGVLEEARCPITVIPTRSAAGPARAASTGGSEDLLLYGDARSRSTLGVDRSSPSGDGNDHVDLDGHGRPDHGAH